jgi:1-deoxy-D-xylulose-5-phosphate reductoisomerase
MVKGQGVTILGATGSIGESTLDLLRTMKDQYPVRALTAGRDAQKLAKLAREFRVQFAAVADERQYSNLKDALSGSGIEIASGKEGLLQAAQVEATIVVAAITGAAGLKPAFTALAAGRRIALANKEALVCAGTIFMGRVKETGAEVLPLDSEHNAVFQALDGNPGKSVDKITLTASGGPFRTWPREKLAHATAQQALKHPTWSMGAKITIDSATLMNKGLELIEAHHLFAAPPAQLDVLVHPQSVVHAVVRFKDGAMIAGLSVPDMKIPIAHCLAWPDRLAWEAPKLDLAQLGTLEFEEPDTDRFPALRLAREAMEAGGAVPCILNAANEIAVEAFLEGKIGFCEIPALVEASLVRSEKEDLKEPRTVNDALAIDHIARSIALSLLPQFAAKAS